MLASPSPLHVMRPDDIPHVVTIQEQGAVAALSHIFPQEQYPFPTERIAEQWHEELESTDHLCFTARHDGEITGFLVTRGDELKHVGTAEHTWGSGFAAQVHDAALAVFAESGHDTAWLNCLVDNTRARRFYEKREWQDTGHRAIAPFPPGPELMRYSRPVTVPSGARISVQ